MYFFFLDWPGIVSNKGNVMGYVVPLSSFMFVENGVARRESSE